jgi:hypothetical protein
LTAAPPMPRVVIESPFQACEQNLAYARRCLADTLRRGEAAIASHLLYPQLLDDTVPDQRRLGMHAGFAWGALAETCAVYVDRGFTSGMAEGVRRASAPRPHGGGPAVVFRALGEGPYLGAGMSRAAAFEHGPELFHLGPRLALFDGRSMAPGDGFVAAADVFAFDPYAETGQTARVELRQASDLVSCVRGPDDRSRLSFAGKSAAVRLLRDCAPDDIVVVLLRAPEAAP